MKTREKTLHLVCFTLVIAMTSLVGIGKGDTQQISLSSGWNFVSFQVEPDTPNIESVLFGLDVVSVWYYDAIRAMNDMQPWLCYKAHNPAFLNNLYEIHARKGYWIEMDSPGVLTVEGQIPATSSTCYPGYNGEVGWNAVGFFSPATSYTVEEILEQSAPGLYSSIWGYDVGSDTLVQLGPGSLLQPGKAYWIETSPGFELTPDVEVSPIVFNFGSAGENGLLQLRNRGSGTTEWQATAYTNDGRNWLGLKEFLDDGEEPVGQLAGFVSFYYKPIYIAIDRGGLVPGEYTGHIKVVSLAKPDFPVKVDVAMTVEPIHGDYSGTIVINKVNGKNIPEMSTGIFVSVNLDYTDVKVVIDSEKSLLFPYDLVLSGGILDTLTSTFSVAGTLLLPEDDPLNPYGDIAKAIYRQIWLETDMVASGNNILGGFYWETVEGLLGQPVEVDGLFELHKVSDTPSNDGSSQYGFLEGTVVDDYSGQPISQANVFVTGTGITASDTTLGDGKFSFYLPDSTYLLSVQAPAYQPLHQIVSFDHTNPESIMLRPIPLISGTVITDFVSVIHEPPLEIPDAPEPGVPGNTLESTLVVSQEGVIETLVVSVDISHDDISDIVVTVVSPQGTSYILHNRGIGENLITFFDTGDVFFGENTLGTWTLRITDYVPGNVGKLNSSSLTIDFTESDKSLAVFTADPKEGMAPLTVQFDGLSDDATEWLWDFGDPYDPTPATERQPIRTYLQPGNYTVSLTANGPGGPVTVTKPCYIQTTMPTGPRGANSSFKWTALALEASVDVDMPPIVGGSGRLMTIMTGGPVIGGTRADGAYVSKSQRADKVMWSGPITIQ